MVNSTIDYASILLDIFISAEVSEKIVKTVLKCNAEKQAWQSNLEKILRNEKVDKQEYAYIIYKAINDSNVENNIKTSLFNLLLYKKNLNEKWFINFKKYSKKFVGKRTIKSYTLHPFYAKDKNDYSVIDSDYVSIFFEKNYETIKQESISYIISLINNKKNFKYINIDNVESIFFKSKNEVLVINKNYINDEELQTLMLEYLVKNGDNNTYHIYNFIDFKINNKYYLLIDEDKKTTTTVHLIDAKINFSHGKINFNILYSCGKEPKENYEEDCLVDKDILYLENLNLLSFHHYLYYTNLITSKVWNKNA